MTYVGNDWQAENRNGFLAEARTPPYDTRVETEVFIAGADVEKHITQLQQMIADGFDAIVTFPVNPEALRPVIQQACQQEVLIIAYSSDLPLECPYAYSINVNESFAGQATAEWLAEALDGKGNVVLGTGVSGTTADTLRTEAAKEVFSQYPDIDIIAEFNTLWDQATAQQEMTKVLAAHQDIDGVWGQVGYGIVNAFLADGRPLIPITGEAENGYRNQIIDPALREQGLDGISYGNPVFTAAYGLKVAIAVLDGVQIPQEMLIPLPLNTADQLKLCEGGDPSQPPTGDCNVYPLDQAPAGFFPDFYDKQLVPELCLSAMLTGNPCAGQTAAPPLDESQWEEIPPDATSRA